MKVIQNAGGREPRVIALGTFDGVHQAHAELILRASEKAAALGVPLRVYTFDRQPMQLFDPARAPKILTTVPEKARYIAELGADELRILHFTRKLAAKSPAEFLRLLRQENDLRAVTAGWNYTFGCRGAGTERELRTDGAEHGYEVLIIPPVKTETGDPVSSTLVRSLLLEGRPAEAAKLMRHYYELSGTVTDGKRLGSRIGFPTANIAVPERKLLPARGVYVSLLITEENSYPSVTNIGLQPTLPSGAETVETHVLRGSPELRGKHVRLILPMRIREEIRFDSVEALQKRIAEDKRIAERWFSMV